MKLPRPAPYQLPREQKTENLLNAPVEAKMPENLRVFQEMAQSLPPGDIDFQPRKIVFNAPYNEKQVFQIKLINTSALRIAFGINTYMRKLRVDTLCTPRCGVLDPNEHILLAVSCSAFAFGQVDTTNDRITVEWTNTPEGSDKQFCREWLEGEGMVRRKIILIEYNSTPIAPKPTTSSKPLLQATKLGMWLPIGFAASELYDYEKGVPLDRETCEKNLEKLIKNDRDVDYYEWLNLAQQCRTENHKLMEQMALGMAFTSAMANKQHKKVSRKADKDKITGAIVQNKMFSIETAEIWDRVLTLPNRKWFQISDVVTDGEVSNWSSANLVTHVRALARSVFDKVDEADPHMMCYATSQNACIYVPIDKDFFDGFAEYLIGGFGQEQSRDLKLQVRKLVTEVMGNKLNRVRARYNKMYGKDASEEAAKWMREELDKKDGELKECQLIFSKGSKSSYAIEVHGEEEEDLVKSEVLSGDEDVEME